MRTHVGLKLLPTIILIISSIFHHGYSQSDSIDAAVMLSLKKALNPITIDWSDPDPCKWEQVHCSDENRVTQIQIGHRDLQGVPPARLSNLTQLERLELQWNKISGPLPALNGLSSLQVLMLSNNMFTSVPDDFFTGMSSLQSVEIDNNPFSSWVIPESLNDASTLQNFSVVSANITGKIPDFFGPGEFPGLVNSLED